MASSQQTEFHKCQNASTSFDGCSPDFDKTFCWLSTLPNQTQIRECPFFVCDHCKHLDRFVTRTCNETGYWERSDYAACIKLLRDYPDCVDMGCVTCPDLFREIVRTTTLALSILSVGLLIISLFLFTAFKSLKNRRLSIHQNLAIAFILRFTVLTLWIFLQKHKAFYECGDFSTMTERKDIEWLCKTILWLTIYFQLASVFWMFVEGGYLVSRFTVFAMRNSEGPFLGYFLTGWGVPLIAAVTWSKLSALHENEKFCWIPYTQSNHLLVLVVPMGTALVVWFNFLFLLAVIFILVHKLQADNLAESKKIWKTIKATLLLVPLLGVGNILLFYEPQFEENQIKRHAYMFISAVLQHSQGIFVSVLYCFLNSEVQDAVKRHFIKLHLYQRYLNRRYGCPDQRTQTTTVETLDGSAMNQRRACSTEQNRVRVPAEYLDLSPPLVCDNKRQAKLDVAHGSEIQPLNVIRNPMHDEYV